MSITDISPRFDESARPSAAMRNRSSSTASHTLAMAFVLGIAGAALLFFSVRASWWQVIGGTEPGYVTLVRFGSAGAGVAALIGLAAGRVRTAALLGAGVFGLAAPLLMIVGITLLDADAVTAAVNQTSQADRLVTAMTNTDVNPQVPWTDQRILSANEVVRNDYNWIDGVESVSYYARGGFFLALAGAVCIFSAGWAAGPASARRAIYRARHGGSIAAIALCLLLFTRPVIGWAWWQSGRSAASRADYSAALESFRKASLWDPRIDRDIFFHVELGRIYDRLGMRDQPDYWAAIADAHARSGDPRRAWEIYSERVADPLANPALAGRIANALLNLAVEEYNSGRPASARDRLYQAIRLDPNNVEILFALGMACTRLGSYHEAHDWWNRLLLANKSVGIFNAKFTAAITYRRMISARAQANIAYCRYKLDHLQDGMKARRNANSRTDKR